MITDTAGRQWFLVQQDGQPDQWLRRFHDVFAECSLRGGMATAEDRSVICRLDPGIVCRPSLCPRRNEVPEKGCISAAQGGGSTA